LIVSQPGQPSRRPHQTYPRPPRDTPWAPQVPEGSTPTDASSHVASLQCEPDSSLAAHLSRAAQCRGGERSSAGRLPHPESVAAGAGVIGLEVIAAISHHQLIVQLPDARLKAGVLLKELSITSLDVLDGVVLSLHLVSALLQAEAQMTTRRCDLLKRGTHVLGVACHERPTRMVGQKLGVTNGGHALTPHCVALIPDGEQGNGGVTED
jgi:hypothetical protein